jgi:heptaprenyl diphosphate synthase
VSTKRIALIAMLVAQATILHYLEGLLPNPIPIPGVKLGLANIITLLALILYDFKTALNIVVLRTILGSLLNGSLFGVGFFLSFTGAMVATCMMVILLRVFPVLSVIGVSVAGAIAHSVGQLLMAALIINQPGIFYYLPFMLLFSIPSGIITGLLLKALLKYIEKS